MSVLLDKAQLEQVLCKCTADTTRKLARQKARSPAKRMVERQRGQGAVQRQHEKGKRIRVKGKVHCIGKMQRANWSR